MSKALEALNDLELRACLLSNDGAWRIKHLIERGEPLPEKLKPGYWLTRISPEERVKLSKLTSDELAKVRPDACPNIMMLTPA